MGGMKHRLRLAVETHAERLDLYAVPESTPLRRVLAVHQVDVVDPHPLPPELLGRPWGDFDIDCRLRSELPEGKTPPAKDVAGPGGHPETITDAEAVRLAYWPHIEHVASLLRSQLPVLVITDKLVVSHLWPEMTKLAGLRAVLLEDTPGEPDEPADDPLAALAANPRQRRLAQLRAQLQTLKVGDAIVLPHLDLLCGGQDLGRHAEARELVELLYQYPDQLVLAFDDTTLPIPDVLAERFSVRERISGLPMTVTAPGRENVPLGAALVTRAEAGRFEGFQPAEFHKDVAGMSPVRLRQAMRYAHQHHQGTERPTVMELRETLRAFKAQQSASFEVPDVSLDDIGGYDDVKHEIRRALTIIGGARNLPPGMEHVRSELVPRGFIFHGPPGNGKTLFAKAIANSMNATIQVVSGPEVTDMYVGESERKVRELFASARRSAPSVIVFDEIDAITMQRSARSDGGARAGNSVVAQILTEMDGFRPDVPMLVIGTTNRIDIIDEALLRPSRFRSIAIKPPDIVARRAILRHHAGRYRVTLEEELMELIAEATEGCNGDELRSLMRDAFVGLHMGGVKPDAYRMGRLVGLLQQGGRDRAEERR